METWHVNEQKVFFCLHHMRPLSTFHFMSNDNSNERINDDVRQRPLIVIPPSFFLFHYHSNGNDVSAQFFPHLSKNSSSDDDNDDKMSR